MLVLSAGSSWGVARRGFSSRARRTGGPYLAYGPRIRRRHRRKDQAEPPTDFGLAALYIGRFGEDAEATRTMDRSDVRSRCGSEEQVAFSREGLAAPAKRPFVHAHGPLRTARNRLLQAIGAVNARVVDGGGVVQAAVPSAHSPWLRETVGAKGQVRVDVVREQTRCPGGPIPAEGLKPAVGDFQ